MKWKDVNRQHDGLKVSVSAKSTPKSPITGEGPFIGTIKCDGPNAVPVLLIWSEVRSFAWWWDVEILEV